MFDTFLTIQDAYFVVSILRSVMFEKLCCV